MKVEDKIALCAIKQHDKSHIELDQAKCKTCTNRVCVLACPGGLYTWEEEPQEVKIEHSGCLECGTCLLVCPLGAVKWSYPEAGFGIRYRFG